MYAIVGAGTGFGPIWARKFTGDKNQTAAHSYLYFLFCCLDWIGFDSKSSCFLDSALSIFLRGLGGGVNWVFSTQLLLNKVPNKVLGRVFSTEFAVMTLASAVAAYFGGWGIDHPSIDVTSMMWWMAALTFIFGLLWTIWVVVEIRGKYNFKFKI